MMILNGTSLSLFQHLYWLTSLHTGVIELCFASEEEE